MAVRRRKPVAKAGPAPTARVHAVQSLEQWENMLAKAGSSNRLVVAQIFQVGGQAGGGWSGGRRAGAASQPRLPAPTPPLLCTPWLPPLPQISPASH